MTRQEFLRFASLGAATLPLDLLRDPVRMGLSPKPSPRMPTLFIGHGHPMNALLDNAFTQCLARLGAELPPPAAILYVSAHWETRGTSVMTTPRPRAFYDFGGFDKRLFDLTYAPLGAPSTAATLMDIAQPFQVTPDAHRELDHGVWTVARFIYPAADVPTFQLSLDATQGPDYHFRLARQLRTLRDQGVLVIASGNVVHNLGRLSWANPAAEP